ncbi:MAG: DUF481 domain-containing protein [bacterium]
MNQKGLISAAVLLCLNAMCVMAEEKTWTWDTEAGYVKTTGNSRSTSANAGMKFINKWKDYLLTLKGNHISANQDKKQSAESYSASEKLDRLLNKKLYIYELLGWEKDRFAGIDRRYNGQLGGGYKIFNTQKHKLDGELGADYTDEKYLNGTDDNFSSWIANLKYVYIFTDKSDFSQEVEHIQSFDDADDRRTNSITSLTAALNNKLALKIAYIVKYDRAPVPGFKKTDTILTSSIILKL